jgi:hypothetical protein
MASVCPKWARASSKFPRYHSITPVRDGSFWRRRLALDVAQDDCGDCPQWAGLSAADIPAALLGDEQTGDLTLHPRRHHDRAWLCYRLHPRRNVGRIAINLARRIDHHRAGFDAYARVKRRLGAGRASGSCTRWLAPTTLRCR